MSKLQKKLTEKLQMHANLMHASGARLAQHDAGATIEADPLKCGRAIFALGGHLADANLVADHFDGFEAFDDATIFVKCISCLIQCPLPISPSLGYSLGEFTLDATHVLLLHLPIADLMLHLAGLLRAATEQQQTGRESIQPMNGAQILQIVLLGQNENDRIVTVSTARMNLRISSMTTTTTTTSLVG